MAGWGISRADTMSTAGESHPMEVTIEQHLQNQRNARQEDTTPQGTSGASSDASRKTSSRNKIDGGKWLMIILAVMVLVCAGLAVGFHFHNQSVLENEQGNLAAAISINGEGGDTTEADTSSPSAPVIPQSPSTTPTQAATTVTVSPTQTTPTTSPTLTNIVIDNPLWTNAPSATPTQATSPPNFDSTVNAPINPSNMPVTTSTPSLRPSLRPNSSRTTAPSSLPTSVATNIATNKQATMNPTVPPTVATSAPSVPTLSSSDKPKVDTSLAPTSKPSLRGSPSSIPTVASTTSLPTDNPTKKLSAFRTTTAPTTLQPTIQPTPEITPPPTSDEFSRVVIEPDRRLNRGDFVFSPNGKYRVGLTQIGDFQLVDTTTDELIWNANITGGYRCFMQGDGNCIIRDKNGKGLWSTKTSKNYDSQLVLDNGGMLGILHNGSYLWIQGVPRGTYDDSGTGVPSANDIQFPVRGAFYYPWYPETWRAGGQMAIFEPDAPLGYYNSADPAVVEAHLDHFEYGNIELGILSWWGQSRNNDRARISLIQNMTQARGSNIKWTVYYEEMDKTKSLEQLKQDLAYMKKWYTWHDTWAKVDGKPVIFVYNNAGCQNSERWMQAVEGDWHVVLKLFGGYEDCPVQPSSWHNYGPAREVLYYQGHSFSISPGFWHAAESEPRLPRVNQRRWCDMVQEMVDSQAPWQLITTFNEAGEGTMIEPSASWASDSGYGFYLDCLHQIK